MSLVLAIDQGTTSSRAFVYNADMNVVGKGQTEFTQYFPQPGWVEHDANEIWQSVLSVVESALIDANAKPEDINAIGITNQRETVVLWDRNTGEPVYRAIVWQDRRTQELCAQLKAEGFEPRVSSITGLLVDPYFSSTKLAWLLDTVEGLRAAANAGDLLFGTIDTWLIWKLTNGKSHVTDVTNASRTMLYDIHIGRWSDEICEKLNIPTTILPKVFNCRDDFGTTDASVFGAEIPICGVAGDQQAATIGQACFEPGMIKATYGTGCFALMNTGDTPIQSRNRMLTTIAYQIDGKVTYAIEGSIFIAGAAIQWMRDAMHFVQDASDSESLALTADAQSSVIVVPSFVGLGAPYWEPQAEGAIYGLRRNSGSAEIARATLEGIGYQTQDLVKAMLDDTGTKTSDIRIRVDGGLSNNTFAMQFMSNVTQARVDRPVDVETTIKGAAWLAGSHIGMYPEKDEFSTTWSVETNFLPNINQVEMDGRYQTWRSAVAATITFAKAANQNNN